MNILFLTLLDFSNIDERNIYSDLLREFSNNGHSVYVISPVERRYKRNTQLLKTDKATILKLKIGNTQKTNFMEKAVSTVMIEPIFIRGIKRYFYDIRFDLIIYSTPPITFCNAVEYVKKRDGAKTYLLLKDIFPQNAVDLGVLSKTGLKGLIYKLFRRKEKKLYDLSDKIGCMSQANVDYILSHNPDVLKDRVDICPNSVDVQDYSVDDDTRYHIRRKYGLPIDKIIFIYGGNLGKPQGINFMIECLNSQRFNEKVFFLIIGDGTEFNKIDSFVKISKQQNVKLMRRMPKDDYEKMVGACDVGLIFLDHRFTIPNFPSRLLSYMQARIPVLAVTDSNTDIGRVITEGNFGWWCESNNVNNFSDIIEIIMQARISPMKANSFSYLRDNYSSKKCFDIIMDGIK